MSLARHLFLFLAFVLVLATPGEAGHPSACCPPVYVKPPWVDATHVCLNEEILQIYEDQPLFPPPGWEPACAATYAAVYCPDGTMSCEFCGPCNLPVGNQCGIGSNYCYQLESWYHGKSWANRPHEVKKNHKMEKFLPASAYKVRKFDAGVQYQEYNLQFRAPNGMRLVKAVWWTKGNRSGGFGIEVNQLVGDLKTGREISPGKAHHVLVEANVSNTTTPDRRQFVVVLNIPR